MKVGMRNALLRAGWLPFPGDRLMSCDYTAAPAGLIGQAEVVTLELEVQPPSSVLLVLRHHSAMPPQQISCTLLQTRVL